METEKTTEGYLLLPAPNRLAYFDGRHLHCVLPGVGPSEQGDGGKEQKEADPELSGIYLIRAVRHHFELGEGRNVTSLNLIRDSYGVN